MTSPALWRSSPRTTADTSRAASCSSTAAWRRSESSPSIVSDALPEEEGFEQHEHQAASSQRKARAEKRVAAPQSKGRLTAWYRIIDCSVPVASAIGTTWIADAHARPGRRERSPFILAFVVAVWHAPRSRWKGVRHESSLAGH